MGKTARTWWAVMVAVVTAVSLLGVNGTNSARAADVVTLNLYIGGDTNIFDLWKKGLLPAFTKRYPKYKANMVELLHDNGSEGINDKILAAKRTGKKVDVDLWETQPGFLEQGIADGLWLKLNSKLVPNITKVPADTLGAAQNFGLPYRGSSVVIGYNSQFVKNPPKTFDGVVAWIKANPGKFTYCDPNTCGSGTAFVTAAIYRYTSAKKFAGKAYDAKDEAAWQPGWKLLKELQPSMYNNGFHPNGNVAVLQLIAQQNIYMASVWSDMGLDWYTRGQLPKTMRFIQITPPLMGDDSRVMVPANSAHREGSLTLLNWLLTPEAQSMVIDVVAGYPGIDWKYMPSSVRQRFKDVAKDFAPWPNPKYLADIKRLWHEQVVGQ